MIPDSNTTKFRPVGTSPSGVKLISTTYPAITLEPSRIAVIRMTAFPPYDLQDCRLRRGVNRAAEADRGKNRADRGPSNGRGNRITGEHAYRGRRCRDNSLDEVVTDCDTDHPPDATAKGSPCAHR